MAVPFTTTRLSQSLALIGVHQTGDSGLPLDINSNTLSKLADDKLAGALDLAEFATSWKAIGSTSSFRISQTKQNYERRGINSPIESFAVVPGPVSTTISMDRATLYYEDAMSAFSFVPGNIAFQTRPLIIIEMVTIPTKNGQPIPGMEMKTLRAGKGLDYFLNEASPIIYIGCWISNSTINYSLSEGNQMVMQNVDMNVARVAQPLSLVPVVGAEAQTTLSENFSITNLAG